MTVESPCTKICTIDPSSGYCLGCGRTGNEIANWLAYTADGRRRIMAALPARLEPAALARADAVPAGR